MFWLALFGIRLPLFYYVALWLAASNFVLWFGFLHRSEEIKRKTVENELTVANQNLNDAREIITGLENELQDINHGYATMAVMIEDIHQKIEDLQSQDNVHDARLNSLEQRSVQVFLSIRQEYDDSYTGPDEEEPHTELNPRLLDDVKGLDEL